MDEKHSSCEVCEDEFTWAEGNPPDANTDTNDDEQNDIEQHVNNKVNKHANGDTPRQLEEREELRGPAFDQTNKKYKGKLCHTRLDKSSVLHSQLMSSHEEDKGLLKENITAENLKHSCDEYDQKIVIDSDLRYHKGTLLSVYSLVGNNLLFLKVELLNFTEFTTRLSLAIPFYKIKFKPSTCKIEVTS